jgi:dTDP-4-dehydrorhamnose reductase
VVEALGYKENPSSNTMETRENSMKLLVTGASGLLGSKLCELAIRKKHEVYSAYSQHKPLHGIATPLDISDKTGVENVFDRTKPEAVVHAAALTNVDRCESERELAWKINVEGTENIAKSCKRHRAFLVYISTDYVFDGEKGMYKETDTPAPINHYGYTKLKGEKSVQNYANQYCIARTSVIFGSIPATGKTNFALWLLDKLKKKEKIRIATDQWNSPTLNTNLANMVLETAEEKITGVYHLAGATRINRYDFSNLIAKTFSLGTNLIEPSSSEDFKWIAKRPKDSSLNPDKAQRTLRNKPMRIEQALQTMKEEMQ